jgi:hypothetical protein
MLQIVASLTDDTRSVNYDRNTFIIQATGVMFNTLLLIVFLHYVVWLNVVAPSKWLFYCREKNGLLSFKLDPIFTNLLEKSLNLRDKQLGHSLAGK